ncbi:MAG: flagellar motor switch protein FliN [Devosiaceae bacterium]|nr:flagellar motor switch protein FliN [Devosiaceae bacterium MH13]
MSDDPQGETSQGLELDQLEGPEPQANRDDGVQGAKDASDLEAVFDVPVRVSAILGRSNMQVADLLDLGPGTVVELDRRVGEAIDIFVNERLVARGEVVLVEDKLGVTMTEIIKSDK